MASVRQDEDEGSEVISDSFSSTMASIPLIGNGDNMIETKIGCGSRLLLEHPMKNPCILAIMFKYCEFNDLRHFRQVSKDWYQESLKFWREMAKLRILHEPNPEFKGITLSDLQRMFESLEQGEDDVFQLKNELFRCLILEGFRKFARDDVRLNWILSKFSNMKHLTLSNVGFPSVDCFMDLIFRKLPNLSRLTLRGDVTFADFCIQNIGSLPIHPKLKCLELEHTKRIFFPLRFPWEQFLENMPNLEELIINTKFLNTTEEVNQILGAVESIRRKDRTKLNIKILEIFSIDTEVPDCFTVECARGIVPDPAALPLEKLSGNIGKVFYLNPYSQTLQYLKALFEPERGIPDEEAYHAHGLDENDSDEEYEKPKPFRVSLPNLKEFRILRDISHSFHVLASIDVPNLEKFVLERGYESAACTNWRRVERRNHRDIPRPIANTVFEHVKCFEFHHEWCLLKPEELEVIQRSMSNITHLKMPLSIRTFPTICRLWPKLESVNILESGEVMEKGEVIDDGAITGIGTSLINVADETRSPNITDLKKLTHFVMNCERGFTKLTERSVHQGFFEMEKLHYLKAAFKELSDEVKSAIKRKINYSDVDEVLPMMMEYDADFEPLDLVVRREDED